jgi:uncharacterized protein YjbJ (UPF0337 family)
LRLSCCFSLDTMWQKSSRVELFGSAPLAEERTQCVIDWNRIEGNWKQFKGQAKGKWSRLTDDDLDVINGRQASSKVRFRNATALPRTRRKGKCRLGSTRCRESVANPYRHPTLG